MIKEIIVSGLRGFGEQQTIQFAIPHDDIEGSGLTIITGPNNSGKTTIIEAIRAFNGDGAPSFAEGKRNQKTGERVFLEIKDETNEVYTITTKPNGGSETEKNQSFNLKYYIVPSRRSVPFEFYSTKWNKDNYISNSLKLDAQRSSSLNNFESRIFDIQEHRAEFDVLIKRVLGQDFEWYVEQNASGSYFIKCIDGENSHNSEGIGDGIWSVFTICAALYDLKENEVVVIDEPELSVHPALQKRLFKILTEYSKNNQIIISTHSTYFIDWVAIVNGAKLIRVIKENNNSKCYTLSEECINKLHRVHQDINNPHIFGTEAKEVFFLEDCIVLVEGQEDVVILNKIAKELNINKNWEFFGWGTGGAEKMEAFLLLFSNLGYKNVAAILDGDKRTFAEKLQQKFTQYKIFVLKEDDIRDKPEVNKPEKIGITSKNGKLKEKYTDYANQLFNDISSFLKC